MNLTDNEKRDAIELIQKGKPLPEKYRFLLFGGSKQVELTWYEKSDEVTNIVLPFQTIEQVDEPRTEDDTGAQSSLLGRQVKGWANKLIWGDNKYILSSLKDGPMREAIDKEGGIKLIYIDPPFDVGADFSMSVEIGDLSYEKKPNVLEHIAYRDTWGFGADSFLSMIYERLILMKDLLADEGSIYVHCDWRLSGPLRLIMDELFGKDNFVNQIIWAKGFRGTEAKKIFQRSHDVIFFYSKTRDYIWNQQGQPYKDKSLGRYNKTDEEGRKYALVKRVKPNGEIYYGRTYPKEDGKSINDVVAHIATLASTSRERSRYPTQKPEELISTIIKTSSNENDLVADFFAGSGTTAVVAEKLNRKWICSDLSKFSIHTTKKRMIVTQRELKSQHKNWRAFEILNLGKYQREHFIYDGKTDREELKQEKERAFAKLILEAYKATEVSGFGTIHGKKGNSFVSIGPCDQPLSRDHVEEVIKECLNTHITSVDILGFEYEMGLFPTIQEEAKQKGLRLSYKQIPVEVFDQKAVQSGEVIFHDVPHIDFKSHFNGRKLSVELTDFAVFYNESNLGIDQSLANGKSKVVIENGQVVKKKKDINGIITEEILTKAWHDWIDYWSVDFDYESKPEVVKKLNKENGEVEEILTGNYVFENEWQSFRGGKGQKSLELISAEREIASDKIKIAVKVVDIFGNDTMKVREVKL